MATLDLCNQEELKRVLCVHHILLKSKAELDQQREKAWGLCGCWRLWRRILAVWRVIFFVQRRGQSDNRCVCVCYKGVIRY